MENQLISYSFPEFYDGDAIVLTDDDCMALIKEVKQQLNMLLASKIWLPAIRIKELSIALQ